MRNVFQSLIFFVKNLHQTMVSLFPAPIIGWSSLIKIEAPPLASQDHLKEKQTHGCSLVAMKHLKSSHQFCLIFNGRGGRRARWRTSQVSLLMSGFHIKPRVSGDASEAQSWEDDSKHLCHSWCDSIVPGQSFHPSCLTGSEEKWKRIPDHKWERNLMCQSTSLSIVLPCCILRKGR